MIKTIKRIIDLIKFTINPTKFVNKEMSKFSKKEREQNQKDYEKWVDSFTLSKEEFEQLKKSKEFNDEEYRKKILTGYYKNKDYRGEI